MTEKQKRIAIIGGGLCGIQAVAALKEEGHEPVCFEATDQLGGTWRYREDTVKGYASIMPTAMANNSKEIGAVSNFPPPKEFGNYMRHTEFIQYAEDYCKHFDCDRHIRYNSEVILVKKSEDYDQTGRLLVTVKDKRTGKEFTDMFDGVVIATGHSNYPVTPQFYGQEKFKGTITHSHFLKHVDKFNGKNILIIGGGCSGVNAAEVMSSVAKNVYLSSRSGRFFLGRQGPNGFPLDYVLLRRYLAWFLSILPLWLSCWYVETFYADSKFDHRLLYVKPKYHWLSKDPVINDSIASKLLSGTVKQRGNIKHFTEEGVVFENEEIVTKIDHVVMATGYEFKFPYLEEGLLQVENGRINLYKCMYPTQLPHNSLVFIGFIKPLGPGVPIGEMQSRYAAHIFSGRAYLPSKNEMIKDVIKRHKENEKRYAPSCMLSNHVDFLNYMDDLASKIGCKPKLFKYLFTDITLFISLIFGPCVSYQYRLEGPHIWKEARKAIMTSSDRVFYPLVEDRKPKKGFIEMLIEFIVNLIPNNIFGY